MKKTHFLLLFVPLITSRLFSYVIIENPSFPSESSSGFYNERNRDTEITNAVRNLFLADDTLAPYVKDLLIQTDKGVVTLQGIVKTKDAKRALEFRAKSAGGVVKVINKIQVIQQKGTNPSGPPSRY